MIIEGTIHDGDRAVPFLIDVDGDTTGGSYTQWGHSKEVLGNYVELLSALRDAAVEEATERALEAGSV